MTIDQGNAMPDQLSSLEKLVNVSIALKQQNDVLFFGNEMDLIIGDNIRIFVNLPHVGSMDHVLLSLKRIATIWKTLADHHLPADELLSLVTRGIKMLGDPTTKNKSEILATLDALSDIRKSVNREGINLSGLDKTISATMRALATAEEGQAAIANPAYEQRDWSMPIRELAFGSLVMRSPTLTMVFNEAHQSFSFTHEGRPLGDLCGEISFQQREVKRFIRQAHATHMGLDFGTDIGIGKPGMDFVLQSEEDKLRFCRKMNDIATGTFR